VRVEGLAQLKNPTILSGFELTTFLPVALGLNQLRYLEPQQILRKANKL
jgi:hypothetical protein